MARSVVYEQSGSPSKVLHVVDVDEPGPPGRGQVLVRVTAFPIHFGDLTAISAPFNGAASTRVTPGLEATGVIEEIGPDTDTEPGVVKGARVTVFPAPGAWQQWVLVEAPFVVAVPDHVADEVAAQMLVNPITAMLLRRAAEQTIAVGYNGVVVQTAAGSSVGRLLTAMLYEHRANVINLVRSEDGARRLAADFPDVPVLATSRRGWPEQVRAYTDGRPITAALDAVGGAIADDLVELLAPGGSLVIYGALASEPMRLHARTVIFGAVSVGHVNIGRWATNTPPDRRRWDVDTAVGIASHAAQHFPVSAHYDLDQISEAVEHAVRPGKTGTILVHAA